VLDREAAARRAELIEVDRYEVTLDLTGAAAGGRFRSTTAIRFRARTAGETFVDLAAQRVHDARLDGVPLPEPDGERIALAVRPGVNELVVDADIGYATVPAGLYRAVDPRDGQVYAWTNLQPADAHRVFACFDQPDLKASYALRVLAPAGWTCVTSGTRRRVTRLPERDATLWEFDDTPPLPPYVVGVVAGPLHEVRDGREGLYCPASLADRLDADRLFAVTRAGIAWYERHFGRPFPFAKYDQCFVPGKAGAMENAACVTLSDRLLPGPGTGPTELGYRTLTVLHELSHMWFGNLVTMRWWDDLWLNEAFANWAATWAAGTVAPEIGAAATFSVQPKLAAYDADQRATTHAVHVAVPDVAAASGAFDEISYHKGASLVRQLVARLGEDAFLRGLRDYFAAFAWGTADLDRLVERLSAASGVELSGWAQAWLKSSGVNTLRLRTTIEHGRYTGVWIDQTATTGDPVLREHRVRVSVVDDPDGGGRLRQRESFGVTVAGPCTSVGHLVGEPAGALLLLNDDDWGYAKVRLDESSTRVATERCAALPRESQRLLCLAIARDMVRDAELPPARFAEMVAASAAVERRPGVLLAWAREASVALGRYAPEGCLGPLAGLAQAYRALGTTPGTPEPLRQAAFEALTYTVTDPDELAAVLAALGRRVDVGDGTDLAPLAARADPAAKETVWRKVFEPGRVPALSVVDLARWFWQPHQSDLLAPYAQRYLAELPDLERRHGWLDAKVRAQRMFPFVGWSADLVERAERLPLTPLVRKVLTEQLDDLRRALAVQAAFAGSLAGSGASRSTR
jgi:aminopeptidase N